MSTREGMRNVVLVPARAGSVLGSPLAAKAYFTPEYPEGIVQRDLQHASPAVQRQTALLWFAANLQPFPAPGVTYFGFAGAATPPSPFILGQSPLDGPDVLDGAIGGFDEGVFAPPNADARHFLNEEFGSIIAEEERAALAEQLPGRWSWLEAEPVETDESLDRAPLVRELALLRRALEAQQALHGGYGHNSRGAPVTDEQLRSIVESVIATQASVAAQQPLDEVQRTILPAAAARPGIAGWLDGISPGGVAKAMVYGAAGLAGKELFQLAMEHVPWLTILHHLENVLRLLHLL